MQPVNKGRNDARRRVSYLELSRAARSRENAKRALSEYHQLLARKIQPIALYSRDAGYFVVEPARS
jgi:hypothetical protein